MDIGITLTTTKVISLLTNQSKRPIDLITSFSEGIRANGFYATPSAIDQYEETQASLVALSQRYKGPLF